MPRCCMALTTVCRVWFCTRRQNIHKNAGDRLLAGRPRLKRPNHHRRQAKRRAGAYWFGLRSCLLEAARAMLRTKQEVTLVDISQADFDHEREVAYRRGYVRGFSEAISALSHKLSDEERGLMDRFKNELTTWAQSSVPSCTVPPPELPTLPNNA
jgi:hypothetical protein